MAESDIQILLVLLNSLKEDMKSNGEKIDTLINRINIEIIPRINQHDADIQDVVISIGKTNVALKACIEDTQTKINALTSLTAPAVEVAEDVKDAKKFWDKVKEFLGKNWKLIAVFIVGIISSRFPEIGKFLGSLIALASGVPPTVTP